MQKAGKEIRDLICATLNRAWDIDRVRSDCLDRGRDVVDAAIEDERGPDYHGWSSIGRVCVVDECGGEGQGAWFVTDTRFRWFDLSRLVVCGRQLGQVGQLGPERRGGPGRQETVQEEEVCEERATWANGTDLPQRRRAGGRGPEEVSGRVRRRGHSPKPLSLGLSCFSACRRALLCFFQRHVFESLCK